MYCEKVQNGIGDTVSVMVTRVTAYLVSRSCQMRRKGNSMIITEKKGSKKVIIVLTTISSPGWYCAPHESSQ